MIRLLIFLGIVYFGGKALKSWVIRNIKRENIFGGADEIDDVMIKDPFCNAYFPRRNGVHLHIDGKDLYFCSEECRDKFIAMRKKSA